MKRIQQAIKAHPFVAISAFVLLCSIINLFFSEDPIVIVLVGGCLAWWWLWAVFGLWQPLSIWRLIISVFCTIPIPFLCAGGAWVSMAAALTVYLALFSIGVYLLIIALVAVRNCYRWVRGKADGKVNPRRLLTVGIGLGCVALAIAAMLAVDYMHRHSLVKQMQQPDIRYNMARRTLGMVLTDNEHSIRHAQRVLLYTQPSGITAEQSELLAEDVRVRLYVDCELGQLPQDLHQMYLDEPTAFHIVLQPPQPTKENGYGKGSGWLAMGEAYVAGIEYIYNNDTDAREPKYLFGKAWSSGSSPTDTSLLKRSYENNPKDPAPPTASQQEQLRELYATLPAHTEQSINLSALPFELVPPPTAIISGQQDGTITIGRPCPNESCKTGHDAIELRWSNGLGGYTLDKLPDSSIGLWRGMGFYSQPIVASKTKAGSLPARLLSSEQIFGSQYQLLIQGSNGFYQMDMRYDPPSEYAEESEKLSYKAWTDWIRTFVREFEEKEPRKD